LLNRGNREDAIRNHRCHDCSLLRPAGSAAVGLRRPTMLYFACTATVIASMRAWQASPRQAGSKRRKQGRHQGDDDSSALEDTVQHTLSLTPFRRVAVISVTRAVE